MRLATIAALLLIAVVPVAAQQAARDSVWALPEEPVAYCVFDAMPLGDDARTRALVVSGVRGLLGSVAELEGGGSSVSWELLQGRVLGGHPWRICLLELEGETVETRVRREIQRSIRPKKFAAVIEVRAPQADGGHAPFLAAIEAGLGKDAAGGGPRDRRELTLRDGLKAMVSSTGAEWQDVAWVSKPEAFVVGLGQAALEKWFSASLPRRAGWIEHRGTVVRKRGRGELVFEAFVDLNALRRGVPDEFAGGKLERLVHAWKIANDRTFMVHAMFPGQKEGGEEGAPKTGERLLAIDVSSSSRAEKPGRVHTVSISEGERPEASPAGADGWAVLVRTGVPSWISLGLDTYEALGPSTFGAVRDRWERRAGPLLEKIVPRTGEWAVLRAGLDLSLMLKAAEGQDRLSSDLRALLSTLAPTVVPVGKGWGLETPEAEEELRGLAWRVENGALVTEWREKKK